MTEPLKARTNHGISPGTHFKDEIATPLPAPLLVGLRHISHEIEVDFHISGETGRARDFDEINLRARP